MTHSRRIDTVFEAAGLLRGSSAAALQHHLLREPGIHHAEANPVSQVVTVGYDETQIGAERIRQLIGDFGCRCGGEIVPEHLCRDEQTAIVGSAVPRAAHAGHEMPAAAEHAGHATSMLSGETAQMTHAMGHGPGMSMDEMVRDMRDRFLVAIALAIPVFAYSSLATEVFGLRLPTPFGISNALLLFTLSTPAVFWSGQIFFVGAYRALRNRTLDMSVLVALSVGSGYVFSVAATFLFEGEVFYEAAVVLLAFVLFGHRL